MIAAIYARVSTEDQAKTGYSLVDQVNQCRKKLLTMGFTDIEEYVDDGFSGEFLDRPQLSRLRNDLRAKTIQIVLVYDPDRLSRNLTNQLIIADEIEKYGAKLDFITGSYDASPEGRLFFSMRGAIAEFEKEKIRERSLRGKKAKVLSGKPLFSREPFGYHCDRENQTYIINEEEAEIVRRIYQMYIDLRIGTLRLAPILDEFGILGKNGRPFNQSTLHSILSNEMYAGVKWSFTHYSKTVGHSKQGTKKRITTLRDKSEWIAIEVPAIIDRETWEKAEAIRTRNKALAKRNTKTEYLLQGFIRCPKCGYAMHGVKFPNNGTKNKEYTYYVCSGYQMRANCSNKKCVPSKELDYHIWNEIVSQLKKYGNLRKSSKKNKVNEEKVLAEAKLKKLKARQAAIVKWVSDGTIDLLVAEKELKRLTQEIADATAISASPAKKIIHDVTPEEVFVAKTFEDKRDLLLRLNITVVAIRDENREIVYKIRG